ncbi:hypothetical protein TELCIR_07316 [Teladorsagia circumcincta]|uniref:Uncharacterized protein n=1 Tax=Teladorsagia circumcincta TaxID=45464 RepID=A0A2G9UKQ2_TELCI|nr:hypothetical protein TELCIR_07316 [Teladorsagia circumcincta]
MRHYKTLKVSAHVFNEKQKNSEEATKRKEKNIKPLLQTGGVALRKRLRNTKHPNDLQVADHLSSCAADMERNANVAREMRAKTEEVERLQRLLENEKKQVQSVVDEWSRKFQENSETVNSKLASLEAELARRDELEKNKVCDHCEILKKRNQIEMEEQTVRLNSAQARIDELEKRLAEGEQQMCKKREELEYILSEKDKIDNEKEEVLDELDRKTESLKEARFIMDGLREEIAAFMTESGREIPMNMKDDEKRGEVYRQLSRVIMIVEAYGRQFEQLEMRLAVEEKRERQSVHDVDVTGTINDLQYRNSELTDEVNRWLRELDGLREEKVNMQKMVSDYRAELESKSTQLERISKSLEDSQKNNTLHLQLINTLKEDYDNKINVMKQQEASWYDVMRYRITPI